MKGYKTYNNMKFDFLGGLLCCTGLLLFVVFTYKANKAKAYDSFEKPTHFLKRYIQINTSHPQPDYRAVVELFKKQAELDGFDFQEIGLPSGNPAVVISYHGTEPEIKSLVLNHHMDVVPATNKDEWSHPPFAGVIADNIIYGRGTQDMKGVGVAHYYALRQLKKDGIVPKRSIHLLLVPDEERGGFKGTKELVETGIMQKLKVGYVLDEAIPSGDSSMLYLKIAERKPIQVEIVSNGPQGHGAQLHNKNALQELILLLEKVARFQKRQQEDKQNEPGNLLSMHITSCQSAVMQQNQVAMNTIPPCATATIDIRVPHHMPVKEALAMFEGMLKEFPNISYTIKAMVQDSAHQQKDATELFDVLKEVVENYGLQTKSLIFEATTDIRYHIAQGIEGVGFTPFTTANNIHGTDEFVPVDDLLQGVDIMYQFLKRFSL